MTRTGATPGGSAADRTAADGTAVLRHGRAFLSWWLAELTGLLPEALRARLTGDGGRAGMVLEGTRLKLSDLRGGRSRTLCELDLDTLAPDEARSAIERALQRAGLTGAPVVLGLPEALILRRRESLPASAERRIADVLRLKLDRIVPLPAGAFHWGYRVAGPAADGRLPVECVFVKAEALEAATRLLSQRGVELSGVFPAANLPGDPALNLLPAQLRQDSVSLWSPLNRVLAAAAAGLAVLALALAFYRQEATLTELNAELDDLRERSASVLALRSEAENEARAFDTVRVAKTGGAPVMEIIDELSRLLPDGTWVSDFRLDQGNVQLTGQSGSASALIGLLERSSAFANVRFGSPVVRDPRTGAERFNLRLDWTSAEIASVPSSGTGEGQR